MNGQSLPYGLTAHAEKFRDAILELMPNEENPALLDKYPDNKTDQVTIDDLLPLANASKQLHPNLFLLLCWHMWNEHGFYRNTTVDKGWSAWMWRHAAIIPVFRHEDLGLFRNLLLSLFLPISWIQILVTGVFDKKTQDGHVLAWHLEGCLDSFIMRLCAKVRMRRMRKAYPGGYQELLTSYFGHEHPLASFWPPHWPSRP